MAVILLAGESLFRFYSFDSDSDSNTAPDPERRLVWFHLCDIEAENPVLFPGVSISTTCEESRRHRYRHRDRSEKGKPRKASARWRVRRRLGRGPEVYYTEARMEALHGTTILLVRRGEDVAIAGDGQVSLGDVIVKSRARKIRRFKDRDVVAGFAGSTADSLSLFARFESKLDEFNGNLSRASVELAKDWRTDKILRHLEALLIVSDKQHSFLISGTGDLMEPDDGLLAIGSGSAFALAAARALLRFTEKDARQIAEESLKIAGEICIYTNSNIIVETL